MALWVYMCSPGTPVRAEPRLHGRRVQWAAPVFLQIKPTQANKKPHGCCIHDHERMVLQKEGLKSPPLWLLVATKCMRGSDDLERALSKEGISFLQGHWCAGLWDDRQGQCSWGLCRQRTTALPPSRAGLGRVVAKHKPGWVRNPVPVPAWSGAPASGPSPQPPPSPFGGECSCFTIKLFFPFTQITPACLACAWWKSGLHRGEAQGQRLHALPSVLPLEKHLLGEEKVTSQIPIFLMQRGLFLLSKIQYASNTIQLFFLHVCPIAVQLKTGLPDWHGFLQCLVPVTLQIVEKH